MNDDLKARVERLEAQVQELSETIVAMLVGEDEEEMDMLEAQHQELVARIRVRDA